MNNRFFFPLLLLLPACMAWGQALTGFVSIQNKKNTPAAPFTIRAVDGGSTDAVVNTPDGAFKLFFEKKAPGYAVQLDVIKPGFEVVNKKNLYLLIPKDPEAQRPLKIYLCRKGEWQHNADSFFQINYRQITTRQQQKLKELNQRLSTAEINTETFLREKDDLRRQQTLMIEEAGRLALLFATANLDDESVRFRRAADYFARGLIDSVLIALPEEDLLRDLEFARRQIRDGEMLQQIGAENLAPAQDARDSILQLSTLFSAMSGTFARDSIILHLAGRVLDDADARPVPGASVIVTGWQSAVDVEGRFETMLLVPAAFTKATLFVHAEGYMPGEVSFSWANAGKIKVYLSSKE